MNPVNFKWKWGEEELPIVDQYTYLGVDISKDCTWDAHIAKVVLGKGKTQVGKMDAFLTDPHLDTRIKRCILMNEILPKLEYAGEVREGNHEDRKTIGNSAHDSSKKYTRMLKYDDNIVIRAELGT